jgi:hypothetical protein
VKVEIELREGDSNSSFAEGIVNGHVQFVTGAHILIGLTDEDSELKV